MGRKKQDKEVVERKGEVINLLKNTDEASINLAIETVTDNLSQINIDVTNRLFIVLLDQKKYDRLSEIFAQLQGTEKLIGESTYIIMIRMYSHIQKIPIALNLLDKINPDDIRKRTYLPIFYGYCQENEIINAFNYFDKYLHGKYAISLDEYEALIKLCITNKDNERMQTTLLSMKNNVTIVNESIITVLKSWFDECHCVNISSDGICSHTKCQLQSIDLSEDERKLLIKNICDKYIDRKRQSDFDKYINFLKKNTIDVFIDGGNILFLGGKVTIDNFHKLDRIVTNLKDINKYAVIILHRRHYDHVRTSGLSQKNIQIARSLMDKWRKTFNIYLTENHMNDDWFWLYGNLCFEKSFVVTNDLLKDHIFKVSECDIINNTLSTWIERHIIKYKFDHNNPTLSIPLPYSRRIQNTKNIWHFPTIDKWYVMI